MTTTDVAPAAGADQPGTRSEVERHWSDDVKAIGGLIAVTVGALVVGAIAIIAVIKNSSTSATIASSAGGVIATIVGAYFGVKVGSDQSKDAIKGQQAEAAKAQVYAAHLPPDQATGILEAAESAAKNVISRRVG